MSTIPVATPTTLGGVIVDGDTITIDESGTISVVDSGSFNSPTVTGITNIQHITEVVTPIQNATGTVTHNFETAGSIFYHTNVQDNFIANFTNMPLENNRSYVITLIIEQANNTYIPSGVSINGELQNFFWVGNESPRGTPNAKEFFTYNMLRVNNDWVITVSATAFGG
jgi:hypothetical protein